MEPNTYSLNKEGKIESWGNTYSQQNCGRLKTNIHLLIPKETALLVISGEETQKVVRLAYGQSRTCAGCCSSAAEHSLKFVSAV